MKIVSSQVEITAQRTAMTASSTTMKVNARIGEQPKVNAEKTAALQIQAPEDSLVLSDQLRQLIEQAEQEQADFRKMMNSKMPKTSGLFDLRQTPQTQEELGLTMLLKMLNKVTGKHYQAQRMEPIESAPAAELPMSPWAGMMPTGRLGGGNGLSVSVTAESHYYESESVSFAAQGQVQTADGQTIAFDVQLSMSREYASSEKITMEQNFADPLVVNYAGSAASLTTDRFSFDLTGDGKSEQIAFAGEGSGFLALDKNGDGTINDGKELFGAQSGDGFADLAAYDDDGNGWIDEGDDGYNNLKVWARDGSGKDTLYSLKELDIGAIHLGKASTEFTVGNSRNAQGVVRSTGVFLKDSGGAGTIQHIDLSM
jgi:hypothetical protein